MWEFIQQARVYLVFFHGVKTMYNAIHVKQFKIIDTSRDVVVINQSVNDYKAHSHFKCRKGALECIDFICRGLMPKSKYYQEACRRLLPTEQYEQLVERKKEKYINVNRGIKR